MEWLAKERAWHKMEADWRAREADWRTKEADWRAIVQEQEKLMASLLTCEQRMLKQVATTKEHINRLLGDRNSLLLDPQRSALLHLKENYMCPICDDIIAAPYSIAVATCGHTFCGVCLLKWFVTLMHECGTWHRACPSPYHHSSALTS